MPSYNLFKGAILPHLTYCSTLWNVWKASDSRKLERVPEREVKTIYRDSNSTYYPFYIIQDIAILMYKV